MGGADGGVSVAEAFRERDAQIEDLKRAFEDSREIRRGPKTFTGRSTMRPRFVPCISVLALVLNLILLEALVSTGAFNQLWAQAIAVGFSITEPCFQ